MNSQNPNDEEAPAVALDIGYDYSNGVWDFENPVYMNPCPWEEWVKLSVREFDDVIHTPRMVLRAPTVIIDRNFNKMPVKHFKANHQSIRERDNYTCQVTGKKLTKGEGNVDHLLPKSRGGKNTWTNLVFMSKEINFKKGDKTLEEAGMTLIRQPKAPLPTVASALIKEARHFSWKPFLISKS